MTYPEPPIILDVDPSGFVQGLGQAERANDQFAGSMKATAIALGPMQRAMDAATPSRAMMAGVAGFTVIAARQQQALSGLAASSKVTGTNYDRLTGGMRQLAREFPIGNKGALEMVTTINRLGVVSTGSEKKLNTVSKAVGSVNKSFLGAVPGIEKFTGKVDSLFGSRGQLSSSGAEKRVLGLSKAFVQLSGATGEHGGGLAAGMIQLTRTMNGALSTDRITKMNDSLTTLSHRSGASATGILSFSKAIAPLAQASGIGQTSVMGISAAFTKLGEDGYGAANAFNKMLGDMHRSVREGTPQMSAYAQIVGKTTDQFKDLFKTNPTEAMLQVVEAIGSSGNAPRLLEQVGLEGVRNARYLTALTQSGQARTEVERAQGAYGNGSTALAADTAFGGLIDASSRLKDNLAQTGEALGRPFLDSVTAATNAFGAVVTPIRELLDNKYTQGAMSVAAPIALGGLLISKVLGHALTATGIGQMLSSGPVRGVLAGYGSSGAVGSGLINKIPGVQRFQDRVATGQAVGLGRMQGVSMGGFNRAAGAGRFMQSTFGSPTGPGFLRQLAGAGVTGTSLYMRMLSENVRLSRTPFEKRGSLISQMDDGTREYMNRRRSLKDDLKTGMIDRDQYSTQMAKARQTLLTSAGDVRTGFRMLARDAAVLGKQLVLTGGSALGRGAGAMLGMVGGPYGAALFGTIGALALTSKIRRDRAEYADEVRNSVSFMDELRTAMGGATAATNTFAGAMAEAAKSAGQAPQSSAQAARIDEAEVARARASGIRPSDSYKGGVERTAQRLRLQAGTSGIKPEEMNRIQQELALSGYSVEDIRKITSGIGSPEANLTGDRTGDIASSVSSISGMERDRGMGRWKDIAGGALRMVSNGWGEDSMSTGWDTDTLSKDARSQITELAKSVADTASARAGQYGTIYANDQAFKEMDEAIKAALEEGDKATASRLISAFQGNTALFSGETFGISESDLRKYGFSGVMNKTGNVASGAQYDAVMAARKDPTATQDGGVLSGQRRPGWETQQIMSGAGNKNQVAQWFAGGTAAAPSQLQASIQALLGPTGTPEDPAQQARTMSEMMRAAQGAGDGLGQLTTDVLQAANAMGEVTQAAFLLKTYNALVQQENRKLSAGTPSEQATGRAQQILRGYNMSPNSTDAGAVREQSQQAAVAFEDETRQRAQQYLTNLRAQRVQEARMNEDYDRQLEWAQADHLLAMDRANEDYELQRFRAVRDHTKQLTRSWRDFNKTMRRMAEDTARAMYAPFERIQVKPTWDAWNLTGNLNEQNDAIAQQVKNLEKLRSLGGSSNLIKLLGLNDPANAQQLAVIVDDVAGDPAVLDALNRNARARLELGGKLARDADNVNATRAREDFQTQLADATKDFDTAMKDMGVSHKIALDRAEENRQVFLVRTAAQHTTALDRLHEDITMANEVITGDMVKLTEAMTKAVSGQLTSFDGLMNGAVEGIKTALDEVAKINFQEALENTGITNAVVSVSVNPNGSGSSASTNERGATGASATATADGGGKALGVTSSGSVTSGFGVRRHPTSGEKKHHDGIDIGVPTGTKVFAYADGAVLNASMRGGYGYMVELNHFDGNTTRYGHMSRFAVKPGFRVKKGDLLGWSGESGNVTGPHLHFETRVAGKAVNPYDAPFALGGIVTGPTRALIGEAGSREAVIPLNSQGIGALAGALKEFVSADDARTIRAAGGTTYVTYDNSTTYEDHGFHVEGDVTVKADDPMAFAAELKKKKALANLTAPPQRRS